MTDYQREEIIWRKQLGGVGVNKGMLGWSLSCQKVIQYVEKSRADMEKHRKK